MGKYTIAQIEKKLLTEQPDSDFINILEKDDRKGVQRALIKWKNNMEQKKRLREQFFAMMKYERKLNKEGFIKIAGVDEVGRGPLAGPVVAAAVILPSEFYLPGIDDSKKLTKAKREEFYKIISSSGAAIGIGMIDHDEIDRININEAAKKAMLEAITNLETNPDCLLIDAMKLDTPYPSESIIKGDGKSVSIAAASIVAKVVRDNYMKKLGLLFPSYGFENNMGYGTKEHFEAIKRFGITPYHRKSFSPIKQLIMEFER
ncbi:ribonuclease HII [Bacillus methanolicus PB1]|uniref:Ribonuclease HII n=1 Tax=Bacillus methanolicus PB1 TaxID=997296 RepID=I3E4U6_BACMT|nr:ribonuclease HII [Bacillus methanolicus]EIJ81517.1 ribonuclease HII [Bacillus methanolicus PB1]